MHPIYHSRTLVTLSLAVSLGCIAPTGLAGQDDDVAELRREVAALRARVKHLEDEFEQGVSINRARKIQPQPGGWRNASNWRLLAKGMDRTEIVSILGEPEDTRTTRKFETWSYGKGTVKFYLRRVTGFSAP